MVIREKCWAVNVVFSWFIWINTLFSMSLPNDILLYCTLVKVNSPWIFKEILKETMDFHSAAIDWLRLTNKVGLLTLYACSIWVAYIYLLWSRSPVEVSSLCGSSNNWTYWDILCHVFVDGQQSYGMVCYLEGRWIALVRG